MGYTHASTPRERMAWVSYVLAHAGEYGVVTALSRAARVSRQTLYAWAARGQAALEQAFQPPEATSGGDARLERDILTLLVEGHARVRGIQRCLGQVGGRAVSLGTISAVVGEAERRALALVATLAPPDARAIALDEIYGRDRHAAYLNIVDVESGAVWAAEGPVSVDGETWILALWLAQERGLRWQTTATDGGTAMEQALRTVDPHGRAQRDVWHVLHQCGQVQGRLDRRVSDVEGRVAVVARQAARVTAGQRPRGRHACVDVAAHTTALTQARRTADDVRDLTMELHTLLEVVVCGQGDILESAGRQREAETLLTLLAQVRDAAPAAVQREVDRLHTTLERALPGLLAFAPPLDGVQQEARAWGASRCPRWPGRGSAALSAAPTPRICAPCCPRRGVPWPPASLPRGRRPYVRAAPSRTGTASCARTWPSIAPSRRACWPCSLSGTTTRSAHAASTRVRVRCSAVACSTRRPIGSRLWVIRLARIARHRQQRRTSSGRLNVSTVKFV